MDLKRRRFRDYFFYNTFWQKCRGHLSAYRLFYLIILICGLAGFGLGIGGAAAYTRKAYSFRFMLAGFGDGYIVGIINGTFNGGRLFWSRILAMLALFVLVLCFGLHRFMLPLHFILVIYRGFLTGFKVMLLIGTYGVAGFFNAIIFILPFETVFFVSLSFVMVCAIDRCLIFNRNSPYRGSPEFTALLVRVCPAACVILAFSILEAILIPVFIGVY